MTIKMAVDSLTNVPYLFPMRAYQLHIAISSTPTAPAIRVAAQKRLLPMPQV
jgi:hypothetical protein